MIDENKKNNKINGEQNNSLKNELENIKKKFKERKEIQCDENCEGCKIHCENMKLEIMSEVNEKEKKIKEDIEEREIFMNTRYDNLNKELSGLKLQKHTTFSQLKNDIKNEEEKLKKTMMVNYQSQNEMINKLENKLNTMVVKTNENYNYIQTRIPFNKEQWENLVKLENKKLDIELWAKEKDELIKQIREEIENMKCKENCIGCIRVAKKNKIDLENMINHKILGNELEKKEEINKNKKNKEINKVDDNELKEIKTVSNQNKIDIDKLKEDYYDHNVRIYDIEKKLIEFNVEKENEENEKDKEDLIKNYIEKEKKIKELEKNIIKIQEKVNNIIVNENKKEKKIINKLQKRRGEIYKNNIQMFSSENGKKDTWINKIKEIENLKVGEKELNYGKRNRAKIIRGKIESTNICTLCGSKEHNELNYDHNNETICDECGFIHNNEICLLDRNYGELIFKDNRTNKINKIIGIDTMNEVFCVEYKNKNENNINRRKNIIGNWKIMNKKIGKGKWIRKKYYFRKRINIGYRNKKFKFKKFKKYNEFEKDKEEKNEEEIIEEKENINEEKN